MRRNILIGLLCHDLQPVSFYNGCEDLPVVIIRFTKKGIDWMNKKIKGVILKNGEWIEAETRFPDAVYNRFYSGSSEISQRLEEIIGNGKVFNSLTLFDKYMIYQALGKSSLKRYMIPTAIYKAEALLALLNKRGAALIKPAKGAMGSHVYKIKAEGGGYKVYLQTSMNPHVVQNNDELISYIRNEIGNRKYVIQPFIDFAKVNGHMFDIRMLVQKNGGGQWHITAEISRVCYKESFVSNFVYALKTAEDALAGTEFEGKLLPYIRKISIYAANLLEEKLGRLGEISVDFGIGADGRLWIIEINGKPDKQIYQELSPDISEKVYRTPIEYALYLAKH